MHFAFQVTFYIMANIALALSVEPATVVLVAAVMFAVPAVGLAWEIHRFLTTPTP